MKKKMQPAVRLFTITVLILYTALSSSANSTASSITSNFNGTAIPGGDYIWFTAVLTLTGSYPHTSPVDIFMSGSTLTSSAFSLAVPNAEVMFSPSGTYAGTAYSPTGWTTLTPFGTSGDTFLAAVEYQAPAGGLAGNSLPVTWTADFSTNTPGVTLNWQWAAAVYTTLSPDYNALDVQPTDDNHASPYNSSDHAGTPELFKSDVIGGARGGGGGNYTGSYSATASVTPGSQQAVPEPSMILPIIGGLLILVGRKSRYLPVTEKSSK